MTLQRTNPDRTTFERRPENGSGKWDENSSKTIIMNPPNVNLNPFFNLAFENCNLLQVSALHYSAGDRVSEGFWTVASARALCQPTSCGSKYFYNQPPQVSNLIGTECSLNRSECRVKNEAS